MSDPTVAIRPAEAHDREAIAALAGELGYPTPPAAIALQLDRVRQAAAGQPAAILVAELPGTPSVVGWVHVCIPADLVKVDVADIWGLVVSSAHRGCGIGRALMSAAEAWAAEHGCRQVRLRSGSHRHEAHAFYQRLGYEIEKSQLTFARTLPDDEGDADLTPG